MRSTKTASDYLHLKEIFKRYEGLSYPTPTFYDDLLEILDRVDFDRLVAGILEMLDRFSSTPHLFITSTFMGVPEGDVYVWLEYSVEAVAGKHKLALTGVKFAI